MCRAFGCGDCQIRAGFLLGCARLNMRILHVVEATIAGVRTYVQVLATGLSQRGLQSTVACPLHRDHAYGDDQFVTYLASAGIPVVPVAMRRAISPGSDLAALWRLVGLFRRERFDIIHLHSSKAGFLGRLAARIAGVSAIVVYSPHGLSFLGEQPPVRRWLYRTLERLAGRLGDRIIAVSPSEREIIIQQRLAQPDQVACISCGVQVDTLAPSIDRAEQRRLLGISRNAMVIGTVARLTPQKNPLLFVEAAFNVIQAFPDAHFVWCGDGEMRAAAEASARQYGIAKRCFFLGHREDVRGVLAALDLFWLTSDYESFGIATAEAMALELPVIATDVVGTCDVVVSGVTGMLVPPRNPKALADTTLALLRDPNRAKEFGRAGRARVLNQYTVDHMLDAMSAFYQNLVPPHKAATSWTSTTSS
jgi:glycosyltransferase involved in cell wall biosynthesis